MALSALHPSCENFVGQAIYIRPIGGWGWARIDAEASEYEIEVPQPFSLRVVRLTQHRGQLNGFLGRVEEKKHALDGLWGVTYLRHVGSYDLLSTIPHTDILLGPDEPFLVPLSEEPELEEYFRNRATAPWYPLWHFKGSPQFGGYAVIAASRELCERHLENN